MRLVISQLPANIREKSTLGTLHAGSKITDHRPSPGRAGCEGGDEPRPRPFRVFSNGICCPASDGNGSRYLDVGVPGRTGLEGIFAQSATLTSPPVSITTSTSSSTTFVGTRYFFAPSCIAGKSPSRIRRYSSPGEHCICLAACGTERKGDAGGGSTACFS